MNASDRALLVVACLLCVGVAASGFVDFTSATPTSVRGDGTADVTVESVPSDVTLARGAFGSGTYHLEADPAIATVDRVEGNPVLKYALDVPGLGTIDTTFYPLANREDDRVRMRFSAAEYSPDYVDQSTYEATLTVWLEERGGQFTELSQQRLTIEVHG